MRTGLHANNNLFDIIKSLKFYNIQSPLLICVSKCHTKYDITLEGGLNRYILKVGIISSGRNEYTNIYYVKRELSKTDKIPKNNT